MFDALLAYSPLQMRHPLAWLNKNEARKMLYREQVKLWEVGRDRVKMDRWNKPKLGKLETPLPRPTLTDPEVSEEG
jgi:hypothetical protein